MLDYDVFMFDFDGTLADTSEGIKNALEYALSKNKKPPMDRGKMDCFIGPPLIESFKKYAGASDQEAEKLIRDFRERYAEKGWTEHKIYGGIPELLDRLGRAGRKIGIATCKPTAQTERVLRFNGLYERFDFVEGATLDTTRITKRDIIAHALKTHGIRPHRALMIGDTEADITGAHLNSVEAMAVGYGFGGKAELLGARPEYFAAGVGDMADLIFG